MTPERAHQVSEWAMEAARDVRQLRGRRQFVRASRMAKIVRQYADVLIAHGRSIEDHRRLFGEP